ncbi:hypothetical protein ACFQEX_17530 [Roseibium salinum]|uniref:hypothetical protein n=1 Tax=Roseibium salinum TaxID=1604349 RepID=UPI0036106496
MRAGVAQGTALAILDGMAEDLAEETLSSFDALPEAAQAAVFDELSGGGSGYVRAASDEEMAAFRKTEDGANLAAQWGSNARRNVSKVNATLKRIVGQLSEADRKAFADWWVGLDQGAETAILKAMVK